MAPAHLEDRAKEHTSSCPKGLLEETWETHLNNLTPTYYTQHTLKRQQTNKNKADQALVWGRWEQVGVESTRMPVVWLGSSSRNFSDIVLASESAALPRAHIPGSTVDNALTWVQASPPTWWWGEAKAVSFYHYASISIQGAQAKLNE